MGLTQEVAQLPLKATHEDILTSILHFIGENSFTFDAVCSVLCDASKSYQGMFGLFRIHPLRGSPRLKEMLDSHIVGGNVVYRDLGLQRFVCKPLLLGEYGRNKAMKFTPAQQTLFRGLARDIVAKSEEK